MAEYSGSEEVQLPANATLLDPLWHHAAVTPHRPMLAYRHGDHFVDITASEFAERVQDLACGFIGLGVDAGDRVALMSSTRVEWPLLDYAILAAGAVTVPIYETDSAEQIEWIIGNSEAKVAIFETPDLKADFESVASNLPSCEHVFVIERSGLDDIARRGEGVDFSEFEERSGGLGPDSVATIIYTSGTTGQPKGCVLTHGNLRWDVLQTLDHLREVLRGEQSQLLFLPLAHSFARMLMLACVEHGMRVGFATDPKSLTEEAPMFRPSWVAAVPRVFERIYDTAQRKAQQSGRGPVFERAMDDAQQWSREERSGEVRPATQVRHVLFDLLVYRRLRAAFGGELEFAIAGGGALGERLGHVFNGVGIRVFEGYGLTETSPVLTANRPGGWKIGTVGQPIPGTTIRIVDDGEILAKGRQVFEGYFRDEEATREAIDEEGFFHTGDLGELDRDGFLRVTGRKKEMIVTAGGKNVVPSVLEDRLRRHPLVSQAMVVGDGRPFIAALVTIDDERFSAWAREQGKNGKSIADLVDDPDLRGEIQQAVDEANKAVSRAESIREFRIIPDDFSIEEGELTPTLKVKRHVVAEKYEHAIEDIYRDV
ncbi:MAG: long-chain fatty acid--CoA ligase [Nitriliruptorales bacterium]